MTPPSDFHSTAGHLLVAMPTVGDPRFHRNVIFIAAHDRGGAMGYNLTVPRHDMTLDNMMDQLKIDHHEFEFVRTPIMNGGPVDQERGFILHSTEYRRPETIVVNDFFHVTATIEALRDIADGTGPREFIFVMGYAGWKPSQIENELKGNAWLTMPATPEMVFRIPSVHKWDVAFKHMGINPAMISDVVGHG